MQEDYSLNLSFEETSSPCIAYSNFRAILPYFTDTEKNLHALFSQAQAVGVDYVLPGVLYLRGPTRKHFLSFLQQHFPEEYQKYLLLYQKGGADVSYKTDMYARLKTIQRYYGISSSYMKPIHVKTAQFVVSKPQLSLL